MRKILLLLLAFVSLTLTLKAQTQSLEDLKLQLEQTDTLYEAEKYDEVLEICLSIGRSTERCDSEQERTVYVRSQILACRCYDQLERYQEGYELSKRLMATQLTDEEKKELSDAYVNSAYFLAVPMMKRKKYRLWQGTRPARRGAPLCQRERLDDRDEQDRCFLVF